jgi:Zn-dependent protease with chaperone function
MIAARYFDGRSTRAHAVQVTMNLDGVVVSGDGIARQEVLANVRVAERTRHGPRRISFTDGAYVEALDPASFDAAARAAGWRDSSTVIWQQSWTLAISALCLTVGVLVASYVWGLPAFAREAAQVVPQSTQAVMGQQALDFLDSRWFKPSALTKERQEQLARAFDDAVARGVPDGSVPFFHLNFRSSTIGPNAFALPGGEIILTDELVKIAPSDAAIIGVLAHELGHLQYRHVMQQLIAGSVIGAVTLAIYGDASTAIAGVGAAVLQAKYSREFESEADQYALDLMLRAKIAPAEMAAMFRALANWKRTGKTDADKPVESRPNNETTGQTGPLDYLSSHPPTAERIERFENAGKN